MVKNFTVYAMITPVKEYQALLCVVWDTHFQSIINISSCKITYFCILNIYFPFSLLLSSNIVRVVTYGVKDNSATSVSHHHQYDHYQHHDRHYYWVIFWNIWRLKLFSSPPSTSYKPLSLSIFCLFFFLLFIIYIGGQSLKHLPHLLFIYLLYVRPSVIFVV